MAPEEDSTFAFLHDFAEFSANINRFIAQIFVKEITHDIEVHAPLYVVYDQWTQFEEFPRFMEGVVEVRQEDDRRLLWRAQIGGQEKQWRAEITEQIPDFRIVWSSLDGTRNSGKVTFEAVDPQRTKVTLSITYEPEGFLEAVRDTLGFLSLRVQGI
jgi:uncharacterized membrane protein